MLIAEPYKQGCQAEILPDIVTERSDGYSMIEYKELIPVLVRAVQELKEELDNLRQQIS